MRKRRAKKLDTQLLLTRPVRASDIRAVLTIARQMKIASMVPNRTQQKNAIRRAQKTLTGAKKWNDGGLLFLATESHSKNTSTGRVIGIAKLNMGSGGYWIPDELNREYGGITSTVDFLKFEPFPESECYFEFGGNYVLSRHQRKGAGYFQTQARVLFLLMYYNEIKKAIKNEISFLFANLLTEKSERNRYEFFETAVSRLLGNVIYEKADDMRYSYPDFLLRLLLGSEAIKLPVHLLGADVISKLGVVRAATARGEKGLRKFGFKRDKKFDALDGGQYFLLPFKDLLGKAQAREMGIQSGDFEEGKEPRKSYVFAPDRKMSEFVCARALARISSTKNALLVNQEVLNKLKIKEGVSVKVLVGPSMQPR